MSIFKSGRLPFMAWAMLFLTACGHSPLAAKTIASAPLRAADVSFQTVALADLASHASDPAYEGKQVSLDASFERFNYTQAYGRSFSGYKLWDANGHWLLAQNIYTAQSIYPGAAPDTSHDLTAAAAGHLLTFGTFAKLTGVFHISTSGASHGGVYVVPPSLDVYTIDGAATHADVNI